MYGAEKYRKFGTHFFDNQIELVGVTVQIMSMGILNFHKAMESLYRAAAFHVTENHCQLRCTRHVTSFVRLYRHELADEISDSTCAK